MNKTKIVCLYQVVMHYRLPFYERIATDDDYEFVLIHGKGKNGTKLVNTNLENITFRHIQTYDIRLPLPFAPFLIFYLIKENPDVIFSEGASALPNSTMAFLYAKIFRKKFVWWSLGNLKNGKKKSFFRSLISKWENFLERNSDAIFTYSSQGEEYYKSLGICKEKIYKAVNVFDTTKKLKEINETFEENYLPGGVFHIGFIGSIQKTKNLELLIDVVSDLNTVKNGGFHLHIIGDGTYMKTLKTYIQQKPNITLYGRMNVGSSKILKNCNLMVLPGLGGLAIVEGMLNGLPIVSGYADGTELDLIDESNGAILPNMNYDNLYNKILELYNEPQKVKRMGEVSFEKITGKYSFEQYYKIFKKMIFELNNQ